ncbi:VOC family protein [Gordonia sp. OPL2]|uniref:VOC family protein n=1 Tax=Gordonia sp. OPL2 TaxID=2486274 RepID=UPI0016567E9C|nr:VOC family protein [Gordonia sp. OPL2]
MAHHEQAAAVSRLSLSGAVIDLAAPDAAATTIAYAALLDTPTGEPTVSNGSVRRHDPTSGPALVHFGTDDPDAATRLLGRRDLSPQEPVTVTPDVGALPLDRRDIIAIDHLVFTAPSRDHAAALFGATLDLDFRLDRTIGDGVHQMFFRADDLVVEVVAGTESDESRACTLWGVAWRSADVDATHRRLAGGGVTTSEVRIGKKPGTRLFTVRDPALATRTVVIGPLPDGASDDQSE